jgi:hypothetical protein
MEAKINIANKSSTAKKRRAKKAEKFEKHG